MAVIVVVGLVDDRIKLRGRLKLIGQFAAALVLVAGGLVIQRIGIFGQQIDLGLLSIPFTLFWLVGAVNAVNLLDGIDGLATMLGFILVATIAGMAALVGQTQVFVIAVVFAGSLLGFLRYNFPPATIFLGDAGSMLIGLVVGALAISGSLKGPGTVLLAAPLAVWTIPIFDSVAAILRRKLSGRSIYTTDRGHIHHRLLEPPGEQPPGAGRAGDLLRADLHGHSGQRLSAKRLDRPAGLLRDRGDVHCHRDFRACRSLAADRPSAQVGHVAAGTGQRPTYPESARAPCNSRVRALGDRYGPS